MKKIPIITLALISFLISPQLKAQKPLELSLDSAISFAIDHNKTLANSRYTVDRSKQVVNAAIAVGLPQVSATADYKNFMGANASIQISEAAPPAVIEFNPTSNIQASVSQLLFSGSYIVGVQMARMAKNIAEQKYYKSEQDVKEQTIQAYYLVLANERILKIIKENRDNVQLIYEKTNNLARAGMIEETEAAKLSVTVATVDNSIKSTERQVELGYNLLRLQLGLDSDQPIVLTTTLDDLATQFILRATIDVPFNLQNNPDYKLMLMQGEIARKQVALNKAAFLPNLSAYYSHTEKIQTAKFDMTPKNVLGLTLNIPIFSGGQRFAQVSQARIDYNISKNSRELLDQQLNLQEKQLRYNYTNLLDEYQNQKKNIQVAKDVLDKMQLKFQQGIVSTLDLTSANSDYLNAETNFTGIMLQLLNAELSLRKINDKL